MRFPGKYRNFILLLAVLLSLSLFGCGEKESSLTVFSMDTVMELSAYGARSEELLKACSERLTHYDNLLSATREGSDVVRINGGAGEFVAVDAETFRVISLALSYAELTGGAYDPTVLPAMLAWDRMSGKVIPTEEELSVLLPYIGYEKVTLDEAHTAVRIEKGMGLDLGGIAKGYASDELAKLYSEYGCSGILNLGGNVYAVGTKQNGSAWRVAIQSPRDANAYLTTVELSDCAAVTSGDYQRYFERNGVRYHHILDPKTLMPAESGLCAVTILDANAARADALATACVVLGEDAAAELLSSLSLRGYLVRTDETIREISQK